MRPRTALRPYQNRVAEFLYERDDALAVVRMGGGKTASALTAIVDMLKNNIVRHALVVAPLRVAHFVWPEEITSWAHTEHLNYELLDGSPKQRLEQLFTVADRQLTIIGIDLLQWLCDELAELPDDNPLFDLLVIDEASRLRNPTGKRAQALAKQAKRFQTIWGLTGTLRPSSALDLFMPARVITRGKLWGRSFYQWRKQHFYPIDHNQYRWDIFPDHDEILTREIAPLIVTLNANEMPQMPELSVIIDTVHLPANVMVLYDRMERKLMTQVDGKDVLAASAGVATGKLAQIANGFIYEGGGVDDPDGERQVLPIHGVKREWLKELIEDIDGQLLILYEFQEDRDMALRVLASLGRLIDSYGELGGGGGSAADDAKVIERWNARKLPFLLMHPASGGHGLNLQAGGSQMAWISPTWGSELWEQTLARLHRPGQQEPVMVRVCSAYGTVDNMKLDRVYRKMKAQDAFEKYLRDRQMIKAMLRKAETVSYLT